MTKVYELSFCKIIQLEKGVHEMIVFPEIEITGENVKEMLTLFEKQPIPRYLLMNKLYPYSYSSQAIVELYNISIFNAIAVIAVTSFSRVTMDFFTSPSFLKNVPIKYFISREQAIEWLNEMVLLQKYTPIYNHGNKQ